MDIINDPQFALRKLDKINVVLGKNGCGKSTLLKEVEEFASQQDGWGAARYITPERGGALVYDSGTEQSTTGNPNWMRETRRVNQFERFRQQTVLQYRRLELAVLREYERRREAGEAEVPGFEQILASINSLLDNVEVRREDTSFKIYEKGSGSVIDPKAISSGESELISLAIECLVFAREINTEHENLLCLDEPDVHLHPDLQARFLEFLKGLVGEYGFTVLIATHSTAILGGLADYNHTAIGLMKMADKQLEFHPIDDVYRKVLPVFGAHPLSNVFNEAPVLLVEGEDDERIWQQAVRSSNGDLKLYPVDCGSVDVIHDYEKEVKKIIDAVYDQAEAFSLRDRDETAGDLDDVPPVVRMKLGCRAAENLLVTNEVLEEVGLKWEDAETKIEDWLSKNDSHPKYDAMKSFKEGGYDRRGADLKELRMLLVGEIFASNKPWEVLVGSVLSSTRVSEDTDFGQEGSIFNYLGEKASRSLLVPA